MIHPASVRERPRAPFSAAAATFILLMLAIFPVGLVSAQAPKNSVGVLVFMNDSNYQWDDVKIEPNSTAFCATIVACKDLGLALNYSMSQYGAFVTEIGGLRAPADFSWWWYLLLWNGANASWEEAPKGASDLVLSDGDLICWCPNSSAPPAPDPLTRYPWPSFRGNSQNTGTGSPGGITETIPEYMTQHEIPVNYSIWINNWVEHYKIWEHDLANGPIDTTPVVAGGRVFVSTGGVFNWTSSEYVNPPHIYAMNATDGRLLWSRQTSAVGWQVSTPTYLNGLVISGTTDGKVLALNDGDGSVEWTFNTGASPTGVTASPAVANGTIFIAAGDGYLYALSPIGQQVWNFSLGGPAYMCTPAISEGRLVTGADNGVLSCVDISNGAMKWNYSAEGKIRASPAIRNGTVYFVSTVYEGFSATRSELHALSLENGAQLWKVPVNASTSSPAVSGEKIFLGTATGVQMVPINGTSITSWPTDDPVQSSPVYAHGHLYYSVNGANGSVHSFVERDGRDEWYYNPKPAQYLMCSPSLADGRLYIASDNGKVYCFGPKPRPQLYATIQVPDELVEGRTVKVQVLLVNNGTGPAENETLHLYADGHRVATSRVIPYIGPKENFTVIFNWTPSAGSYDLRVGGFGVAYPVNVEPAKTSRFPAELLLVAIVLLLVTIPIILLVTRKPIRKEGRGDEEE